MDKISSTQRCFPSTKLRVVYNTRTFFSSFQKDVLPTIQSSSVIYKFLCRCGADYVGRTTQRLEVRISQHVPRAIRTHTVSRTSGNSQAHDSAIGDHLLSIKSCSSRYSDEQFSVLHRARSNFHLNILEAIVINTSRPSLCK